MLHVRKAISADQEAVWALIQPVIAAGDTYVFSPDSSKEKMLAFWFSADKHTYVATIENRVVGTFFLKDNQPDLGSHIANAGYIVASDTAGHGVGQAMCEFSLEEAKRLGYRAMQFNIVVKSNERAVRLWQRMGFQIIGEIPDAFQNRQGGFTNAFIMYRTL